MIKNLPALLSEGESYTVEFKETADKSLAAEVCAFANASGGKIFIGVNDKGVIKGTDVSNAARSRVQDTINQIEPMLKVKIEIQDNIIIVTVPEGKQKPYSCSKGFYLRSGPNSQKLERDSIIEFLQSEGKVIYDSIISDDYPVTDNFNETEYKTYLIKSGISDILPRESILKNLGCADISSNGNLSFTNAGLLFFRDNTQNVRFDFTHVVCALYKGIEKVNIIDAKNLNGSIIENIDNAMVFLKRNLRERYEIKTVQRKNILELPEDALREAVTNAVCHRDYFEKGARVMVEIFDDRVEITNPGTTPKGITKDNFGSTSITRNPVIASLLHRVNYIERMGTGIKRMNQAMEALELEKPVFQTEGYFFKVVFKRDLSLVTSEKQTETSDKQAVTVSKQAVTVSKQAVTVSKQAVNEQKQAETSDKKGLIIDYISKNNKITAIDTEKLLKLSGSRVRKILKEMVDDGIIEKVGSFRGAYYILK